MPLDDFIPVPSSFSMSLQRLLCIFMIKCDFVFCCKVSSPKEEILNWKLEGSQTPWPWHPLKRFCGLSHSACLLPASLKRREVNEMPALHPITLLPLGKVNFRATEML